MHRMNPKEHGSRSLFKVNWLKVSRANSRLILVFALALATSSLVLVFFLDDLEKIRNQRVEIHQQTVEAEPLHSDSSHGSVANASGSLGTEKIEFFESSLKEHSAMGSQETPSSECKGHHLSSEIAASFSEQLAESALPLMSGASTLLHFEQPFISGKSRFLVKILWNGNETNPYSFEYFRQEPSALLSSQSGFEMSDQSTENQVSYELIEKKSDLSMEDALQKIDEAYENASEISEIDRSATEIVFNERVLIFTPARLGNLTTDSHLIAQSALVEIEGLNIKRYIFRDLFCSFTKETETFNCDCLNSPNAERGHHVQSQSESDVQF